MYFQVASLGAGSNVSGGQSTTSGMFGKKQRIQTIGGSIAGSTAISSTRSTKSGMDETVEFQAVPSQTSHSEANGDEAMINTYMNTLRNKGVHIVAHGSRGKPKQVRLKLTNDAITWRTETRRKNSSGQSKEIKYGKLHSVALANIMYVDVGKQTTALRRQENAQVPEELCFSLLTKEGSLDLEANSPRERDALVGSFSLILDNVHAQNWRDIYRSPNEDMPSSFDEYDEETGIPR